MSESWEWQHQAACLAHDLALFFHPDGERGKRRRSRQDMAKAICKSCPVLRQCREHALAFPEHYGTWGGLTEEDRDRLRDHRAPFGRRVRRTS
ncbi:redox-responsive transcriptional regulator WhiB3 [Mycolicibacterium chitae]|uniref:Transcriptional regulator WhiB n=1 Tax=Mycolicibacterium chitae TaxID=1792 RepID=A0A3S4VLE6_MYCCI|nr:WhiB family transcriptional regulator [Mycolicibacterium chitae]MCV7109116.1 WhiB family transcriptional regulator [Mycolicibacterium chitae]BBZ01480.1 redox-responsive transcriptional regulator WhiB3 [Mycolicibacterium chitae]VEG50316.1 whiB3 [Mycolicibacterium chitae]